MLIRCKRYGTLVKRADKGRRKIKGEVLVNKLKVELNY